MDAFWNFHELFELELRIIFTKLSQDAFKAECVAYYFPVSRPNVHITCKDGFMEFFLRPQHAS